MKNGFWCFVVLSSFQLYAQETKTDSLATTKRDTLELNIDVVSRYIWRGQSWGGNYVAAQPTINYGITDKLKIGFWATFNFKNEYFYPDGTAGKGYQEIDFSVSYAINSFMTVQLWDYYWPTVERVEGIDNGYFNYGRNGTKTVDATFLFDFSEYDLPLNLTLSTLVAGNDFRYDSKGEHPKQNYTTYIEAGYSLEELVRKITFDAVVGMVLNNEAAYYTAGDYDRPSLVNFGLKATREFQLTRRITMPVSLNYIHNAATKNTEFFGRNFLIAGITFNYK